MLFCCNFIVVGDCGLKLLSLVVASLSDLMCLVGEVGQGL